MTISNKLTIFRIILVPLFVVFLLIDSVSLRLISCGIFIIASFTDMLDGYLARSRNEVTEFGKFADPIADKILVISAYLCLVELDAIGCWGPIVTLFREFIISGIRMTAATKNVVIAADKIGKIKTVLQMISIVMLILNVCGFYEMIWWRYLAYLTFYAGIAVTIISGISYVIKNKNIIF